MVKKENRLTYASWHSMIYRCTVPSDIGYARYGGRGITVCERWMNSFDAFKEDMGLRPSASHSIERKDNSLGYTPENCRWATRKEQSRNIRTNALFTYQGRTQCLMDWAEELGFRYDTLWHRLNTRKWSVERAFTTPAKPYPHQKLSKEQKDQIRTRYAAGGISHQGLADEWGVSRSLIGLIIATK